MSFTTNVYNRYVRLMTASGVDVPIQKLPLCSQQTENSAQPEADA
jgi:hypothetical protein